MMTLRYFAIAALGLLGSCTVPADTSPVVEEDRTVKVSRTVMVGMSEADVRMCAGFPTMGVKIADNEKIWTYQRIYARGTINFGASTLAVGPTPGLTGGTGLGTPGFCYTQIRFLDGKVSQVEFAGDNNTATRVNGLCVSTVDRCVVYAKGRK
ncbi:hypothetical protein IHQ71_13065 [Rhizobium sp. TH2]|uniref:hypothetical protein n=1 Tax=Rhizobium sp. TH2 TaxID=2775403 RepID=UPI002157FB1F|nr:hypothetical protein [Rhizobium sp. TH2]UVC11417.1 hypothetical protein IHQ71_13065 [Rhizobium sp. TH2]